MSIRQATLLAFRDHVLLKLVNRLEPILEEMNAEGSVPPAIRQMFLVLQVHIVIPRSIVILGKLIVAHIVKKFMALYGSRLFISVCTRTVTGSC
jgi:hypothetical protein